MSNKLPQGWVTTTLGEICSKPQYGWTCKAAKEGQIKYLRTTDISGGRMDWNTVPFCEKVPDDIEKYRVRQNDILVSRAGSVGISYRISDASSDAVFASYLIRFKPLDDIQPKWLEMFLKSDSYWRSISRFSAGIAIPNVNASKLASLEIPLAPLAEQRRIVAKLEKLLERVDACRQGLAKIPVLLKRFRQSVLAAACSGGLTADWREVKGLDCDQWSAAILGDVADLRLGKMLDKAKNVGEPTRYLRNINVRWFSFELSDLAVMRATAKNKEELSIMDEDLLVCEGGDPGRCAVWNSGDTDLIFQKAIHRVRPREDVSSRWVALNIKNDANRARLDDYFTGTTIKHLTGRALARYKLRLPPLAEQREIARRVESLFALADRIEARYSKARDRVDKLTQSILAKAFCGKLVPQNPEDEPASVLLDRIRSGRR